MKYVALLRGINVGGNSMVKMLELKEAFENEGFSNVSTYINSGNVLFESDKRSSKDLEKDIEKLLAETFFAIKTVVVSFKELESVIEHAPHSWKNDDLRKYVAFIKDPSQPEDIIKEAQLKQGIDFLDKGPRVVYMTTKMEGLTKSNFPKLAARKIYQDMTIRNYNTVEKLFELVKK